MLKVHHGHGYTYSIQYQIFWCVKFRHDVLTEELEKSVKKILYDIARKHDFTILEMETIKTISIF